MKPLILFFIRFYQRCFSRPGVCRFYPSCSHYSASAIKKYGIITGVLLSLKRILKCNPWGEGGLDYLK